MLLSHQGGWDEMVTVLLPLALLVVMVWLASRRAKNPGHGTGPDQPETEDTADPD